MKSGRPSMGARLGKRHAVEVLQAGGLRDDRQVASTRSRSRARRCRFAAGSSSAENRRRSTVSGPSGSARPAGRRSARPSPAWARDAGPSGGLALRTPPPAAADPPGEGSASLSRRISRPDKSPMRSMRTRFSGRAESSRRDRQGSRPAIGRRGPGPDGIPRTTPPASTASSTAAERHHQRARPDRMQARARQRAG